MDFLTVELFLRKSETIRLQESKDQIVVERLLGFQNKSFLKGTVVLVREMRDVKQI